jgi:hypothetical protein
MMKPTKTLTFRVLRLIPLLLIIIIVTLLLPSSCSSILLCCTILIIAAGVRGGPLHRNVPVLSKQRTPAHTPIGPDLTSLP